MLFISLLDFCFNATYFPIRYRWLLHWILIHSVILMHLRATSDWTHWITSKICDSKSCDWLTSVLRYWQRLLLVQKGKVRKGALEFWEVNRGFYGRKLRYTSMARKRKILKTVISFWTNIQICVHLKPTCIQRSLWSRTSRAVLSEPLLSTRRSFGYLAVHGAQSWRWSYCRCGQADPNFFTGHMFAVLWAKF